MTLCNANGDVDNDRLEIFRIKQNLITNKEIIQDGIQNDALEYLEMLQSYENFDIFSEVKWCLIDCPKESNLYQTLH